MQINCILIASNFVIHPQILIFLVFQIANLSPYSLQIKFSMSLFFYLFKLWSICGIGNSSQQTSLQCLSTINMVLSDEGNILIKSLYLKGYTAKRLTDEFPEKAGQSVVSISCSKSCGTQAQLTHGQAAADHAVPTLKKMLSYCRNFWSRSLAHCMRAAQFASVISCVRHLLKHFRCTSLQIIQDTEDRWIPISCDSSRTVLWVCRLFSWLRTKPLTVSTFSSVRAQIDGKSK